MWKILYFQTLSFYLIIFFLVFDDIKFYHTYTPVLEKALATHSSSLAWKIPWTEDSGRLQSMGSLRVGHDWATSLSLSCIGEGNGNPLQCSCLENPRDEGTWWAAIYGVAQSHVRLKQRSSSRGLKSGIERKLKMHWWKVQNLKLQLVSYFDCHE